MKMGQSHDFTIEIVDRLKSVHMVFSQLMGYNNSPFGYDDHFIPRLAV
jgi:hypothetical protein